MDGCGLVLGGREAATRALILRLTDPWMDRSVNTANKPVLPKQKKTALRCGARGAGDPRPVTRVAGGPAGGAGVRGAYFVLNVHWLIDLYTLLHVDPPLNISTNAHAHTQTPYTTHTCPTHTGRQARGPARPPRRTRRAAGAQGHPPAAHPLPPHPGRRGARAPHARRPPFAPAAAASRPCHKHKAHAAAPRAP